MSLIVAPLSNKDLETIDQLNTTYIKENLVKMDKVDISKIDFI